MIEKLKSPVLRFPVLAVCSFLAMLTSFFIMLAGMLLGAFLRRTTENILFPPHIVQSDAYIANQWYLNFIGIWIICLAVLAIFPQNRHILKILVGGMKGNNLKMLLVGMGIGFAANLVCAFAAIVNGNIQLYFDSLHLFPLLLLFAAVFIQSSAEELVFRGYLYHKILSIGGRPLLAVILNCALFSYSHSANSGVTPLALVNLFLFGILCSSIVVYMDSIWAVMGIHTAWNFCQNFLLGLPNSGAVSPISMFKLDAATATDSFAYSVGFGLEGSVATTAVLTVSLVLVWLWHRKHGSAQAE